MTIRNTNTAGDSSHSHPRCTFSVQLWTVGRLVNAVTFCSYACTLSGPGSMRLSSMLSVADEFLRLLSEFAGPHSAFSSSTVKHGVEHYIFTTGPPVHAQARHLDPDKLMIAKAEFENMDRLGIIHCSNSSWASPQHLVPRPGGGWRPCGGYCRLNDVTT